jgi:hypothetical protein
MELIFEAIIIGLILVIIWAMVRHMLPMGDLPAIFIIAAAAHLGFEASGVNSWYCKSGHACTQ